MNNEDENKIEDFREAADELVVDELQEGTKEAAKSVSHNDFFRRLMDKNFLEYASYVIKDRAIPNVDDGLKPVQRRILWVLHKTDEGGTKKTATIVGDVMGKYHPHGDASIKDALTVLANKEYFIKKQGNFGNIITGDGAAAPRYTECGLTQLGRDVLFCDEITSMVETYDSRNMEPIVLPVKIPGLLMLGSDGIAVGMKTTILPHNFNELLKAQIAVLNGETFELYPDFLQGGIVDVSEYDDGNGKVTVRAKMELDGRDIIIREIPYGTDTEKLMQSIEKAADKGKIKISNIQDFTNEVVEIRITPTRGQDPNKTMSALYMHTNCSMPISTMMTVIKDNRPCEMSITEVIHRNTEKLLFYLKAELEIELNRMNEQFHAKTLAQIFFENRIYKRIEEVTSEEEEYREVEDGLKPFLHLVRRELKREDIDKLLALPVRRISRFDIEKNQKELREIDRKIAEINKKLKNLTQHAIDYLNNLLEKYGSLFPRRTEIVHGFEKIDRQKVALNNIRIGWDKKEEWLMDHQARYKEWLENVTDERLLEELQALQDEEIKEKFYKELSFGTGGLRGVLGVGTACLNIHTVERITEGVARYIEKSGAVKKVAISHDSRINSALFAQTAARVFAAAGVRAVLTKELMPTPFLSFLTREEGCGMGVMITASHNPAVYNGYKVYGADGCQITDGVAGQIAEEIAACGYFGRETKTFEEYFAQGLIEYASERVEESYLQRIAMQATGDINGLSVAYTPLHGTGRGLIPKLLQARGIGRLELVEEQMTADGNFPTCPAPNPEKAEALALGLQKARETGSELLIATDPDADRIGIAVRHQGEYRLLTGNETGALLCEYLLSRKKSAGSLAKDAVVIKTIVTTDLVAEICKDYGCELQEVLTGFKYIGERVGVLESEGRQEAFVLGLEESYGYLTTTFVRDKDAVSATQAVCEMAAFYKKQGKTLVDVLCGLYEKYGYFENKLLTYSYPGSVGVEKMKSLIKRLREDESGRFLGRKLAKKTDYLTENTGLPASDVLRFETEDGGKVLIRPSGTEPLVKAYVFVKGKPEENEKNMREFVCGLDALLKNENEK